MANEPTNAEEQLKQYAEERRQQVPQQIHPATRNVLQGEVRRTFGSPEEERSARFRMRWLQALAWVALIAAIPLFLMPRNPATKESQPGPSKDVVLPTANKPGAPIELSDTREPVKPPVIEALPTAPAKVSAPASAAQATTREEARTAINKRITTLGREPERAKKVEVTRVAADAAPANNTKLNFANNIPNQEVLKNFQLEQNGRRITVRDSDGSVYSGGSLSQQSGADTFQVAGMNRTLKQSLILTGQVMRASLANVVPQQTPVNVQSATLNSAANNSAVNNSASNNSNAEEVRVQGAAIVGNTQYKVDAQAAPGQ
jgi:hypothetical protein